MLRLGKPTAERKIELSEEQVRLLERFSPEFRERHIEAPHTASLVAVDTFFVGALKGVGKVYLQTAADCHSRLAWARLYPSNLPVTAVHMMHNAMLPTFEAHEATIEVVLSTNGQEFCGRPDQHPYELLLQLEDIQHPTLLDDHFSVEGRPTSFETMDERQKPLDESLDACNAKRPHQDRGMKGGTPARALIEGIPKSAPEKGGDKTAKTNQKQAA